MLAPDVADLKFKLVTAREKNRVYERQVRRFNVISVPEAVPEEDSKFLLMAESFFPVVWNAFPLEIESIIHLCF